MLALFDTMAYLLVPAVLVVAGGAPVRRARLESFAVAHQIPVTEENGPMLVRHLARTRRFRCWCAAAGWLLAPLPAVAGLPPANPPSWSVLGYLVGALLAELTGRALQPVGPPRADLTPRRVADYVSPTARLGPIVLAVLAPLLLTARLTWPPRDGGWPSDQQVVGTTVAVVLLAVVLVCARRWIASRRQPALAEDVRRADDALRANAMQTLSGGGLAVMCFLMQSLTAVDVHQIPASQVLGWLRASLVVGLLALGVVAWFGMRTLAVPVRRRRVSA
ncbi:MAG TPA: hypothetical protein VLJ59_16320 [Mycobacteriales bacterium]|nr:hypothetical protein [Mycobacteriales bacterium]